MHGQGIEALIYRVVCSITKTSFELELILGYFMDLMVEYGGRN
jgi:hypothetical protein